MEFYSNILKQHCVMHHLLSSGSTFYSDTTVFVCSLWNKPTRYVITSWGKTSGCSSIHSKNYMLSKHNPSTLCDASFTIFRHYPSQIQQSLFVHCGINQQDM